MDVFDKLVGAVTDGELVSNNAPKIDIDIHHQNIRLFEALNLIQDQIANQTVNVAVIDTGVDHAHPSLKDSMFVDPNPLFPEEKHGINAHLPRGFYPKDERMAYWSSDVNGPGKPCEQFEAKFKIKNACGHGTHVAGIIAGKPSDLDKKYRGVCPVCKIIAINAVEPAAFQDKVFATGISDRGQIRGLGYVLKLRDPDNPNLLQTHLVNMSIGKTIPSRTIFYYVNSLYNHNVGVIAASGNSTTTLPYYPAAYGSTISVAASGNGEDNPYAAATFSNYGDWIDITAPGQGIYGPYPGGQFMHQNGTSQAAPIVAGAIGLAIAHQRTYKIYNLYQQLKRTSHFFKIYEANPAFRLKVYQNEVYLMGHGYLDVYALIQDEKQSVFEHRQDRLVEKGCAVSTLPSRSLHWFEIVLILSGFLFSISYPFFKKTST
jgi:subtilisin family serine protease